MMRPGEVLQVRARKADGSIYRSWSAVVETVGAERVVTIAPAGSPMQDRLRGTLLIRHALRSYYWVEQLYNLIEVFDPRGSLIQIYVNIASPPRFVDGGLDFVDHELDVTRLLPGPAQIVDQDEFAEAVLLYGYTREFQDRAWEAARRAVHLADHWQAATMPTFGGDHA